MYASSAGGGAMALVFKPIGKDGKQAATQPVVIKKKPARKRATPSRRAANA